MATYTSSTPLNYALFLRISRSYLESPNAETPDIYPCTPRKLPRTPCPSPLRQSWVSEPETETTDAESLTAPPPAYRSSISRVANNVGSDMELDILAELACAKAQLAANEKKLAKARGLLGDLPVKESSIDAGPSFTKENYDKVSEELFLRNRELTEAKKTIAELSEKNTLLDQANNVLSVANTNWEGLCALNAAVALVKGFRTEAIAGLLVLRTEEVQARKDEIRMLRGYLRTRETEMELTMEDVLALERREQYLEDRIVELEADLAVESQMRWNAERDVVVVEHALVRRDIQLDVSMDAHQNAEHRAYALVDMVVQRDAELAMVKEENLQLLEYIGWEGLQRVDIDANIAEAYEQGYLNPNHPNVWE